MTNCVNGLGGCLYSERPEIFLPHWSAFALMKARFAMNMNLLM